MEKLRKDDAKDNIKKYENQLVLDELSERTIKKYIVDVEQWLNDMPDIINKTSIVSVAATRKKGGGDCRKKAIPDILSIPCAAFRSWIFGFRNFKTGGKQSEDQI